MTDAPLRNGHDTADAPTSLYSLLSHVVASGLRVFYIGDIGSGHTKFGYSIENDPRLYEKEKVKSRLASGTQKGHREIREEALLEVEQKLRDLRPLMDLLPQDRVKLYVTSAIREYLIERGEDEGNSKIMKHLREAADGRRVRVLTGKEEADYIRISILDEIARISQPLRIELFERNGKTGRPSKGKKARSTLRFFAAMGGGSVQFGIVTDDAEIASVESAPYGIEPLITESKGKLRKAGQLIRSVIKPFKHTNVAELYVAGGNWRDIADIIKKFHKVSQNDEKFYLPLELSFKAAKAELTRIKNISRAEFDTLGVKDRNHQEITVGATALLNILEHYKAEKLIISNATIRQAVAKDEDFNITNLPPAFAPPPSSPPRPAITPQA